MYQQVGFFAYKSRLVVASGLAIAYILLISSLVTAIGSHTVLDPKTHAAANIQSTDTAADPNAVTTALSGFANGSKHVLLAAGTTLYKGCQSITMVASQSGKAALRGSAIVVHALGSGMGLVVHLPSKMVGSVASGHAVSAVIKPADASKVPIISSETSAAILAQLNARQQQEIAQLQAAQAAANRGLGGLVVAGDPGHGDYPAKWDTAPQDSLLDNWGMYNRECVSYAAWKVFETYGYMPYWGGVGNANQWVRDAQRAGIPTGGVPAVHSVAISRLGYYGHAMWVEKVSGNMIYVSQYNYDLHGHYSEMWVNGSSFTYIYFK